MGWFRSPHWTEVVFQVLDLETSGLDPRRSRILSVGVVPIRSGAVRWGERWYTLVRPPTARDAETDAVRVHEILPDELGGAPELSEIVPQLESRLTGAALVVHWRALDVAVLKRAFREHGRRWPRPPVVDTAVLLARLDRRRRLLEPTPEPTPTQLAAARKAFGLPRHREHDALYDALATAELFLALRARLGLDRLRQMT
jgi:DNA polymerase-3 subunit epsilon